jgi:hypothetical protein
MAPVRLLFSAGFLSGRAFSAENFAYCGLFFHPGQVNSNVANFYDNFLSD